MPRKISPIEAALRDYQDGGRVVVDRPAFVPPIPADFSPDVHTEVECMFASLYDESRRCGLEPDYDEDFRLVEKSLQDALDEGEDSPVLAGNEVYDSFRRMSRVEATDPHMLRDEIRRLLDEA
jgi:hypothetical protein